jgi:hypothetical protein
MRPAYVRPQLESRASALLSNRSKYARVRALLWGFACLLIRAKAFAAAVQRGPTAALGLRSSSFSIQYLKVIVTIWLLSRWRSCARDEGLWANKVSWSRHSRPDDADVVVRHVSVE